MDSMSYRNNRPQPRPTNEPELAAAPPTPTPEPEQPVVASHAPTRATVATHTPRAKQAHDEPKPKRRMLVAGAVAAVLVVFAIGWFMFGRSDTSASIDGSKYQAVFFTNGQVYFGKMSVINQDYMRLKNVYYLQNKSKSDSDSSPQSASKQDASNVELIKLGNEIHGPEDEMVIAKDQILFFENLKPKGTVSTTILNSQSKGN